VLKRFTRLSLSVVILQLLGCQSTSYVPPSVTAEMAKTGNRDVVELRQGRTLFVSRCIECHALPSVAAHTVAEWPRLIDEMADRASLKPAEREALVAYIIAARARM
jgi:mono/diheme cytochrome c family protein